MRGIARVTWVACALLAAADVRAKDLAQTVPSVRDLLDRYPAVTVDFRVLLKSKRDLEQFGERFTRDADAWIQSHNGGNPRRRQIVAATLALDVAHASLDVDWSQGKHLIEWGSEMLRKTPVPDEGERLWHLAALPLIQGAVDYRLLIRLKDDIWLPRFPNEPRLLLALIVMLEGDTWPEPPRREPWDANEASLEAAAKMARAQRERRTTVTADNRAKNFEYQRRTKMRRVMMLLEDLSNSADARAEALLRLGVLHLRLRNRDVARDQFEDVVKLTSEPFLVYLAHFFMGVTDEQAGERSDAIRAYRAALAAMPRAQAASFALASLLFLRDEREEAVRLVDAAVSLPAAVDPWRAYQSGDFRLWPERIGALRKALQ
jgi:hypothetical protein